jgi:F-type H+-transporting ATPase subunit gamma
MDQLPRLNARLGTLMELRDIVRAMRAVAAGATREGEAALPAVRRYSEIMDAAIGDGLLLAGAAGTPGPAEPTRRGRRLLCIIGTDHGFVGNLNARLVQEAVRPSDKEAVFIVGRRAAGAAAELRIAVAGVMSTTAHVPTIPLLARRITERIAAYDEVRVAFCAHRSGSGLTVVERQIVPIVRRADAPRRASPPLHHLRPAALLRAFAEEYRWRKSCVRSRKPLSARARPGSAC